jgi:hypothetical protein
MQQNPSFRFKKGLMACANNDILFSGGDTGSSVPEVKKPVLPKELTGKFGALKCDLCKVSVSLLNLNFLRHISYYISCKY